MNLNLILAILIANAARREALNWSGIWEYWVEYIQLIFWWNKPPYNKEGGEEWPKGKVGLVVRGLGGKVRQSQRPMKRGGIAIAKWSRRGKQANLWQMQNATNCQRGHGPKFPKGTKIRGTLMRSVQNEWMELGWDTVMENIVEEWRIKRWLLPKGILGNILPLCLPSTFLCSYAQNRGYRGDHCAKVAEVGHIPSWFGPPAQLGHLFAVHRPLRPTTMKVHLRRPLPMRSFRLDPLRPQPSLNCPNRRRPMVQSRIRRPAICWRPFQNSKMKINVEFQIEWRKGYFWKINFILAYLIFGGN
jgi:hypothetical protein